MMNLLKLFFAVVTAHLGVIGLLFLLPGCQTLEEGTKSDAPKQTSSLHEEEDEETYASINDDVEASSRLRRPPTRPTWNLQNTQAQATLVASGESEVLEPVSPEYDLPPVSDSVGTPYTVQRGDTLWGISRRYGVPVSAIAEASGISAKSSLKVGQTLTIPSSSAGQSTPSGAIDGSYIVKKGDTLSSIAAHKGTTVAALKQANGLTGSTIRVGQTLSLPGATAAAPSVVKTSSKVSAQVPSIQGDSYTVARGDTLSRIAKRTGVPVSDLMSINGIEDPTHLQVGQVLALKGRAVPVIASSQTVETPSDDVFDSAEAVPVVETVEVEVEEDADSEDFGDDSIFDSVEAISVVPVEEENHS